MKKEIEKKRENAFESSVPNVTINPELEKYRGKILFPEQLKRANEMLKKVKLPPNMNIHCKAK